MALLTWRVVHGGKTPPPGDVVRPDERLSWPRTIGLGAQHVVAMFGATPGAYREDTEAEEPDPERS
jgi:hypothetical protein